MGLKKNLKRDPGIPNMYPFKKELLEELLRQKETEERVRQIKRLQAKEQNRNQEFAQLLQNAESRALSYEELEQDPETRANSKDPSYRAYFRQLMSVIDSADIILEVLDARDPGSYRSPEIESRVMSYGSKRVILVVNKIDLVPHDAALAWYNYLSQQFPCVLFRSNIQSQSSNLSHGRLFKNSMGTELAEEMLSSTRAIGVDALMNIIKNYMRTPSGDTLPVTIGVMGYPNVGKSSVINSLKRSKAVGVSSQPGYTVNVQEVEIESKIKILDTPGIVFSGNADSKNDPEMVLKNVVRIEQLDDPYTPVQGILQKVDLNQLLVHFSIPTFEDISQFLGHIARKRGKLKKGGIPDFDAAAKIVLYDWVTGKIPFYTFPPINQL